MNYPGFPDSWLHLSPPVWFPLERGHSEVRIEWFRWRG
jgi:hypothetical protein